MSTDFYAILGVSKSASQAEIKARYQRLAKALHPDVNANGEELFKEVAEAYAVLGDVAKRAKYDAFLKRPICMCGGTMCDGSKHKNEPRQTRPRMAEFVSDDGKVNFFAMTASVTPDAMRKTIMPLVGEFLSGMGITPEAATVSEVLTAAGMLKKKRSKKSA
jgi:DnaJ-class molecular chaperone